MLILGLPASTLIAWLLAVAFLGAGIANVAGSAASKAELPAGAIRAGGTL